MIARRRHRPGATLVEAALIYPVMFLVLFAVLMLGVGVFRHQQVCHLTREASRWLSVHGSGYYKDTNRAAPTQDATRRAAYDAIISPDAGSGIPVEFSDCTIQWLNSSGASITNTDATTIQPDGTTTANRVSVTIRHTWNPGIPLYGPMSFSSTSVCTMSN